MEKHALYVPQYIATVPEQSSASNESQNWVRQPPRLFIQIAGFLGTLAVALGAYGTHALEPSGDMLKVYNTANLYHILHALLLLAVGFARYPRITGLLITIGVVMFCGTCYLYVFTHDRKWIQGTPIGGSILLLSWATFIL